ncbi:MAG TPA: hypothetical protein VHO69_09590 [Phototrophicaceae bacterium]|nr:hypothetical protein [Phototrophicaceae bacterium]
MKKSAAKRRVILVIILFIAAFHIISPARQATLFWRKLYYSYFSDLILPFGFYFLLCASDLQFVFLRRWWVKAGLVFGAAVIAEGLQFLGVYALGVTFDPLDVGMYAAGVLLAVIVE